MQSKRESLLKAPETVLHFGFFFDIHYLVVFPGTTPNHHFQISSPLDVDGTLA